MPATVITSTSGAVRDGKPGPSHSGYRFGALPCASHGRRRCAEPGMDRVGRSAGELGKEPGVHCFTEALAFTTPARSAWPSTPERTMVDHATTTGCQSPLCADALFIMRRGWCATRAAASGFSRDRCRQREPRWPAFIGVYGKWEVFAQRYENGRWLEPIPVPQTQGGDEAEFAVAADTQGNVFTAMVGDHRQWGDRPAPANHDILFARLRTDRQSAAPLAPRAPEPPTEPNPEPREAAQVAGSSRLRGDSRSEDFPRRPASSHRSFERRRSEA